MKNFVRNTLLLGAVLGASASAAHAACCPPTCEPYCCDDSLCGGQFTIGGEYLYWRTDQKNIVSYVTQRSINDRNSEEGVPQQNFWHVFDPDTKFESGYRVYAGYEFPCCQWEIGASYTYIPGKADLHLVREDGFQPIIWTFDEIDGKWNSTFSYFDLDLARNLAFGECFTLRPHMGFRAIWGDQKWRDTNVFAYPYIYDPNINTAPECNKQEYQGYGVEGGLWAEWNVACNFSVVGHFGGSIVYNRSTHKNTFVFGHLDETGVTPADVTITRKTVYQAIPSVDYFLGLRYASCFCDWEISAHAGWESHVWFDLGNVFLFEKGNFSTQGLTAGLEVGF